jgi:glycosyltransferase involved in cell wall biosynthesis
MRIWLLTIGEPLPTDGCAERLLRTGILAEILARRGHKVVWWSSTFDHARKRQRFDRDTTIDVAANYNLRLLHGSPYARNVSIKRWFNHRKIARKFSRQAAAERQQPDLILCSLPTVELCRTAIEYGQSRSVPVAIDIRDLWPQVFVDHFPSRLHNIARLTLSPLFAEFRMVCQKAGMIFGTTDEYISRALESCDRRIGDFNRAFPLGYRRFSCTDSAARESDSFWKQHGVPQKSAGFTCCYFGNMGRHSTLETVIAAARTIQERGIQMRFVLCGTGDKLAHYRALADGCPAIVFPGWIDAAQISSLMSRSSVGLAPYISNTNFRNNIPNKPIEYLSAGLPIVSSLEGVLERLLADHKCGVTYKNDESTELASLLTRLMRAPGEVEQMSQRAHALFNDRFDAEIVYEKMADHLEHVSEIGKAGEQTDRLRARRIRPRTESVYTHS